MQHQHRECGECTACCQGWVYGDIHFRNEIHEMKTGCACHFLRSGKCSIYEDRPETPCRQFKCGWLTRESPFPAEFRPDKLGVLIVLHVWRGRRSWILTTAGRDPSDELMEFMRDYTRATGEPHLIKRPGKLLCYGSPLFQQDMLELERCGKAPW
ncbi:MAG: hypothetical protein KAY82_03525 [Hylemonella sp.]|nr:hypothetical protein [Hylemonella sp.]